jgi:hypothetical protein
MDEKLRKFNIFLSKDTFTYEINSEYIRFVRVFWYRQSHKPLWGITGISPTAYSFLQLTAALTI